MLRIIAGKKGTGKTKILLEQANKRAAATDGSILYIDKDTEHMYMLDRKIRLINISDFPITTADSFIGFICGILAQDYDTSDLFLDAFMKISCTSPKGMDNVVKVLDAICRTYKVNVTLSVSESEDKLSEYVKQFISISL